MSDNFNRDDDNEYERELFTLVLDFARKIKSESDSVFYDVDDWLDIIDYFLAENTGDELLPIALEKALEAYPNDVELIIRKAHYSAISEPQRAYEYLCSQFDNEGSKIPLSKKGRALVDYQKGKILNSVGFYATAFKLLWKARAVSENQFVDEQLAVACLGKAKYNAARMFVESALTWCEDKVRDKELTAYGAGDFFLLSTSVSDNLLSVAARLCLKAPNLEEKITARLEKIVSLVPFETDYWEALAEFHLRKKDYAKADEAYEYCQSIAPDNLDFYLKRISISANTLDKRKQCLLLERMLPLFAQELSKETDSAARKNLVDMWKSGLTEYIEGSLALKWYDKCIECCNKVLETNKKYPLCDGETFFSQGEVRIFIALALQGLGKTKQALQLAMLVVKDEPEYYGHRIHLASLLYDSGDVSSGEEVFQSLYEQCCEQSAASAPAFGKQAASALYFQKHKYYVVAAWAEKMAQNGRAVEALRLIGDNFPEDEQEFDNETFILNCAKLAVFNLCTELKPKTYEFLEHLVYSKGYSIEAILHRVPALLDEGELVQKIRELKKKTDDEYED